MTPLLAILLGFVALIIITVIAKVVMDNKAYNTIKLYFRRQYRITTGDWHIYDWPRYAVYFVSYFILCFVLFLIFNVKTDTERSIVASIPIFLYAIVTEFRKRR